MRLKLSGILVLCVPLVLSHALSERSDAASCTLTASPSGDDAPQFLAAVSSCATVVIPKGTTLNIATRLNMTSLSGTHIVSPF